MRIIQVYGSIITLRKSQDMVIKDKIKHLQVMIFMGKALFQILLLGDKTQHKCHILVAGMVIMVCLKLLYLTMTKSITSP